MVIEGLPKKVGIEDVTAAVSPRACHIVLKKLTDEQRKCDDHNVVNTVSTSGISLQ